MGFTIIMMKIGGLLMFVAAHAIDVDSVMNAAFLETQATMQVSTEMLTSMMSESFAYTTDHAVSSKLKCPMGKVGCPLCYDITDKWNSKGKIPQGYDTFCDEQMDTWRNKYQTLTGKEANTMKKKTRCV